MTRESDRADSNKPYVGFSSYESHDSDLFFGRTRETDELATGILCDPLTILHAPSGAGKTSLLNAAVLPTLEANNWLVIRIRIAKDSPIRRICTSTLDQALPPIEDELRALQTAREALSLGPKATLGDLFESYGMLHVSDPRRRDLIGRGLFVENAPSSLADTPSLPWFCRLLRGSVPPHAYHRYLVGLAPEIQALFASDDESPGMLGERTELGTLEQALSSPELFEAHRRLRGDLDLSVPGLRPFFDNFFATLGARIPRLQVILLFDQFEEIFTLFVDPRPLSENEIARRKFDTDWRARPLLFNDLARLYEVCLGGKTPEPLPIRFVFSLREEYVARLQRELRRFVPDSQIFHYFLGMLETRSAEQAIKAPARFFGYRYDDECYELILRDLTREGHYVEPKHLQVVCDKLWEAYGREKAQSPGPRPPGQPGPDHPEPADGDLPAIDRFDLEQAHGVAGILSSVLRDFLDELADKNPAFPFEAIQMMQLLVTSGGTRNIVEKEALIQAPFRPRRRRQWIFDRMVRRGFLRTEKRLGGKFVEITHEFLIRSVQDDFRRVIQDDPTSWHLSLALQVFESFRLVNFRDSTNNLPAPSVFELIHEEQWRHETESRRSEGKEDDGGLDFSELWSRELMFRCALAYGHDRSTVKYWGEQYRLGEPDSEEAVGLEPELEAAIRYLSADALRELDTRRDELRLGRRQLAHILRSVIVSAQPNQRDTIRYWVHRLQEHDTGFSTLGIEES